MKKTLWLLLLIPVVINAKANISSSIECQEELTIGSNISCKVIIDNHNQLQIKSVSFKKNNDLLNLKSNYELTSNEDTYNVVLDSNEEKIDLFTFNFLMDKNNANIAIEKMDIITLNEEISQNVSKILSIKNIAYADQIYINNIPIVNIERDIYNYAVNIYERTEYIEIKTVTSGQNKAIDGEIMLIKYAPTISVKVANDVDTEIYNISLNYRSPNTSDNIKIDEIPFKFNPNKRNYYFEVENNIYKINISNSSSTKEYPLNIGSNNISFDNDGEIYNFVVKRLKTGEVVSESFKLKSIKFGNTYLNLRDEVYKYDYIADKIDIVTVETNENQDYEIKYSSNKIRIIVYNAKLGTAEYTINLVDDTAPKKEIKEYDNSKNIVIFLIFLLSFILILLLIIKKRKKERIN